MLIGYYLLSKIMSGFSIRKKNLMMAFFLWFGGYIKRRQKSIKWNQYLFQSYIKSIYYIVIYK